MTDWTFLVTTHDATDRQILANNANPVLVPDPVGPEQVKETHDIQDFPEDFDNYIYRLTAAGALVRRFPAEPTAAQQTAAFLARISGAYIKNMEARKQWWTDATRNAAQRARSANVMIEFGNWQYDMANILSQGVTGRIWAWSDQQKESAVAAFERMAGTPVTRTVGAGDDAVEIAAGNLCEFWYLVGLLVIADGSTPSTNWLSGSRGYADGWVNAAGQISVDGEGLFNFTYGFDLIPGANSIPAGWRPDAAT